MWEGYEESLKSYYNEILKEWIHRGYGNNLQFYKLNKKKIVHPAWLGNEKFHASHRSNLLRKNPNFYSKYGWEESSDLSYVWFPENIIVGKEYWYVYDKNMTSDSDYPFIHNKNGYAPMKCKCIYIYHDSMPIRNNPPRYQCVVEFKEKIGSSGRMGNGKYGYCWNIFHPEYLTSNENEVIARMI